MRVGTRIFAAVMLLVALAGKPASASVMVDGVNETGLPDDFFRWHHQQVGWTYVPPYDYTLTGIGTHFARMGNFVSDAKLKVWEGTPATSLTLLAWTFFDASPGDAPDIVLRTPAKLVAGHEYFVSFEGIYLLGVNHDHWLYAEESLDFWGGWTNYTDVHISKGDNRGPNNPILRFWGERAPSRVPEPGTWSMIILGFSALGGVLRRSRRRVVAA